MPYRNGGYQSGSAINGCDSQREHQRIESVKDKLNRDEQHLSQNVYTSLQGILMYRLSQGEQ